MHTLRTIVATAVVTLAASTVAYAGMNGVGGQAPAAPAPVKALAAHSVQSRTAAATVEARAERKHERQGVRHRDETRHTASGAQTVRTRTHEASHETAPATAAVQSRDCVQACDRDQTCDPCRTRDRDQTRDRTCDQTRDQSCRQSGGPAGEHAGDGGHAGEGCGG